MCAFNGNCSLDDVIKYYIYTYSCTDSYRVLRHSRCLAVCLAPVVLFCVGLELWEMSVGGRKSTWVGADAHPCPPPLRGTIPVPVRVGDRYVPERGSNPTAVQYSTRTSTSTSTLLGVPVCTLQSALCSLHSAVCSMHSAVCTLGRMAACVGKLRS